MSDPRDVLRPVAKMDVVSRKLILRALKARSRAYAPYSHYLVGCALEDEQGKVHTGCNVETANYAGTICAERTALAKMVSRGGKECVRIVIVTSSEVPAFPCGECLQMIQELGSKCEVLAVDIHGKKYRAAYFRELMPYAFSKEMLTP